MKKNFLSLSFVAVILVMVFSLAFAPKVHATTMYGYGFASKPVVVYADSSFSSTYISQLNEAINAWNSAGAGTLLTYGGTKTSSVVVGTGIFVTSIYQSSLQTASTLVTVDGSNIVKAVVSLNSKHTFNNGGTSSGTYYLKSVFMHELGHALGLADNTNSSSIMYGSYTGSTNITSYDLSDINTLY